MKEKTNKNKLYILLFVIIYIVFLIIAYNTKFEVDKKNYFIDFSTNPDRILVGNERYEPKITEITQQIKVNENNFGGFRLNFSRHNGGSALIGIKEVDTNKTIKEWKLENGQTINQRNVDLLFDEQKESKGKTYEIYIRHEDPSAYKLSINTIKNEENLSTKSEYKEFYINNEKQENKNMDMSLFFKEAYSIPVYTIGLIAITTICLGSIIYILYAKKISIEKIFLITIPILSLIFLIIVPIGRNNDETVHSKRVLEIADGQITTKIQEKDGKLYRGEFLDKSYKDIALHEITSKYRDVSNSLNVEYDGKEKAINNVSGASQYSPIVYLPGVILVLIAKMFVNNPMLWLYFARLGNLIVILIMLYYAIKTIPKYKALLYIGMLSPSFLSTISAISADGITIGAVFLFIAFILNIRYNKEKFFKIKDFLILLLIATIIALGKTGYITVLLFLFLIPKNKIKIKANIKYAIFAILIMVPIILNLLWYAKTTQYNDASLKNAILTETNTSTLKEDPFSLVKSACYSLVIKGQIYVFELYGGEFLGWSNVGAQIFTWLPMIILTFLAILKKEDDDKYDWKENSIMAIFSVITIGIIFGIFYLISRKL